MSTFRLVLRRRNQALELWIPSHFACQLHAHLHDTENNFELFSLFAPVSECHVESLVPALRISNSTRIALTTIEIEPVSQFLRVARGDA